jgi:uncharacterized membrane protein required for colicin V production
MIINAMFLAVAMIFIIFIILGYIRGLFKSVFKFLAGVLAMALSYLLAPVVGNAIINYTALDDYISNAIETSIEAAVRQTVEDRVKTQLESTTGIPVSYLDANVINSAVDEAMNTEPNRNQQIEVISNISAPEFVRSALIENNQESIKMSMGVDGFYEYISTYISYMIINSLSFAISAIIINIILTVISAMLSGAVNIPIINNINRIGGMAFGFAEALIIVWILFTIVGIGISTSPGGALYNQITENRVLNFINDKNVINNVIAGIIKISDR